MTAESATARLGRLLTMVPWLLRRQGVDIAETAAEFGVSTQQVESDLALLFLCGTPGGMPDDLIEAEWEGGKVYLGNADTIARPLRLGVDEALTLVVGLRTLAAMPGLEDREVIDRTLAKLEATLGARAAQVTEARIQVAIDDETEAAALARVRDAVARRRRLRLRYLVPSRDEATDRDVDPMRLTNLEGHWYLEGWCHRSGEVRLFRVDRMERADVLDIDGTPPPQARPRDLEAGVFTPREDDLQVVLDLQPEAAWVADYYPHEALTRRADGSARVTLRTGDTAWLRRLLWRLGGTARAVAPDSLVTEVAEGAAAALAEYAAAGAHSPQA